MEKLVFCFDRKYKRPLRRGQSLEIDEHVVESEVPQVITLRNGNYFVRARIEQNGIEWKLNLRNQHLFLSGIILNGEPNIYDHCFVSVHIFYVHKKEIRAEDASENRIIDFTNLYFCNNIERQLATRLWDNAGRTNLGKIVIVLREIDKWERYNKFYSPSHRGVDSIIKLNGKKLYVHSQLLGIHSVPFLHVLGKDEEVENEAISAPYFDNKEKLKCCDVRWDEGQFLAFIRFMYGEDYIFYKQTIAGHIETAIFFKGNFHIARIEKYIANSGLTLVDKVSLAWKYRMITLLLSLKNLKEFSTMITLIPKTEYFQAIGMTEKQVFMSYLSSSLLRCNNHHSVNFVLPVWLEDTKVAISQKDYFFFFSWFVKAVKTDDIYSYYLHCNTADKDISICTELYNYQMEAVVEVEGVLRYMEFSNSENLLFAESEPQLRTEVPVAFKRITITTFDLACHLPVSAMDVPGNGLPDTILMLGDLSLFHFSQVLRLYSPKFNFTLRNRRGGLKKGYHSLARNFLYLNSAPQIPMELLFSFLTIPAVLFNNQFAQIVSECFIVILAFCKIHYINMEYLEKLFIRSGFVNNKVVYMRFFYKNPMIVWIFDLRLLEKHLAFLIDVGEVDCVRLRSTMSEKEYRSLSKIKQERIDLLVNSGEKLFPD